MRRYTTIFILFFFIAIATNSCKHEAALTHEPAEDNYPPEISQIITTRCATAGCHNASSYQNSGGLRLDKWEHLFEGSNNGAVIVPFSPDYSPLLYFINTDSNRGPVAIPTMPVNGTPLTASEYETIRSWVQRGAPDKNGRIAFADFASTRQKIYMVHQSCDMMAVIDAASHLVMRYIPIGEQAYPEAATGVRVSPDGRTAYLSMWYSNKIFKLDTDRDTVIAGSDLGNGFWSTLHLSDDGSKLAATNGDNNELISINTSTLQPAVLSSGEFMSPHGIASNAGFDTFFVSGQYGNTIYKHSNGNTKKISLDGQPLTSSHGASTPDPIHIQMAPDYSKYFVSCVNTNEIRVMDPQADTLIKVIPVGVQPTVMTISRTKPYLFVSCTEDANPNFGHKGTVYVINYNTLQVVKKIEGRFYQPYALAVDDQNENLFIFSRNQNYDGPAPHHEGPCSGRNGFYSVYNLNTLELSSSRRHEVLVDPYSSDVRFK